jgi:hypothetical protein
VWPGNFRFVSSKSSLRSGEREVKREVSGEGRTFCQFGVTETGSLFMLPAGTVGGRCKTEEF